VSLAGKPRIAYHMALSRDALFATTDAILT